MAITRKSVVISLILVFIILTTTLILLSLAQPPYEVILFISSVLENTVVSISILVICVFMMILGIVIVFVSDNEYIVALGILISFISIVIIVTLVPRLIERAEKTITQFFRNGYNLLKP